MTGYGRGERVFPGKTITVELRAVNNRYFDCSIRIPRIYLFLEEQIKSTIQKKVARGKVDVFVSIDGQEAAPLQISVNRSVAEGYYQAHAHLSQLFNITNDLTTTQLAKLPDVLLVEKSQEDLDETSHEILAAVEIALGDFQNMRSKEGEQLRQDLLHHGQRVEALLLEIEAHSPRTMINYRQKLEQRLKEMMGTNQFDEGRILTEIAIFADKVAVSEETVRLHSHLSQLRELLLQDGVVGRKLDFLIQEFNREANTIGSKCCDIEMSRHVVDMKAEIEKMREQTQNVE